MMRALYSGVTGLRNHQTKMDVVANNISNVNTAGFKASRVIFQDIYSQTLTPASGSNATNNGGTNPQQIGLGTSIAAIDIIHTSSASQYTGNPLDLMVEGDGYFVLSSGSETTYTRSGNFYTDEENYLVNANGEFVQGYVVDPDTGDVAAAMSRLLIDPSFYDVTIDQNGAIIGLDRTTQDKATIGQLVIATFANNSGLEKVGDNSYRSTINSGDAEYNTPGIDGAGLLNPGSLEMSNVDLAGEFTDMIVTQRGFQANSRIITTSDSMLEEIVNLKR